MTDSYIYAITALLPLSASMLVFQTNPYHALVMRGILGAIAALLYIVLGAPDVALTEALVGTMLAITLYAVAVRSSLVLRLGVLEQPSELGNGSEGNQHSLPQYLVDDLRVLLSKGHQMRLELVNYTDPQSLYQALLDKEVHAICTQSDTPSERDSHPYHLTTRVRRIYNILKTELSSSVTTLSHIQPSQPVPTKLGTAVVGEKS